MDSLASQSIIFNCLSHYLTEYDLSCSCWMKHRWGYHLSRQERVTDGWLFHCIGLLWNFTSHALKHLMLTISQLSYCPVQSTSWSCCNSSDSHCCVRWLFVLGYGWRFISNSWMRLFLCLIWLVDSCAAGRQNLLSVYEILNLGFFLFRLPFIFVPSNCLIPQAACAQVYLCRWKDESWACGLVY